MQRFVINVLCAPTEGFPVILSRTDDQRFALAEEFCQRHRPRWRWASRRCMRCGNRWPCEAYQWALGVFCLVRPQWWDSMVRDIPRLFVLNRRADVTGRSGTGVVALGVMFTDGKAVTRWRGTTTGVHQISVWDSLDEVIEIHGHDGSTEIVWLDDEIDSPDLDGRS